MNFGESCPANCGINPFSINLNLQMKSLEKGSYSFSSILEVSRQLEQDIIHLDFESLNLHERVKSYFRFDLGKIKYVSECNAFILFHILNDSLINIQDHIIIDHGAGIGFFSFLVKRIGAKCISHDISEEYLEGIKILAKELNAEPDYYILGDTDILVEYCNSNRIKPTGLGSRNVIEHLPDYAQFFKQLSVLKSDKFNSVITTSANIHNPIVKQIHRKIHSKYETLGSNMDMDNPTLDTANCGMKLRSEIIKNQFPELDQKLIEKLAKRNRGFVKAQIIERTQAYIQTGLLPVLSQDSTNTCDPFTGAWVERLVSVNEYERAAQNAQFKFSIIAGFYNTQYHSKFKNIIAIILNKILKLNPPFKLQLSPFLAMKLVK